MNITCVSLVMTQIKAALEISMDGLQLIEDKTFNKGQQVSRRRC